MPIVLSLAILTLALAPAPSDVELRPVTMNHAIVPVPAGWSPAGEPRDGWSGFVEDEVSGPARSRLAFTTESPSTDHAYRAALDVLGLSIEDAPPRDSEVRVRTVGHALGRLWFGATTSPDGASRFVGFAVLESERRRLTLGLDTPADARDRWEPVFLRMVREAVVDRDLAALVAPAAVGLAMTAARAAEIRRTMISGWDVALSPAGRVLVVYERRSDGTGEVAARRLAAKLDVVYSALDQTLPAPDVPPRTALFRSFATRKAYRRYASGATIGVYRRDGDEAVLLGAEDESTAVAFQLAVDDHFDRVLGDHFVSDWLHVGERARFAGSVGPASRADGPWPPGMRLDALLRADVAGGSLNAPAFSHGDAARFVWFLTESEREALSRVWAARVAGGGRDAERDALLEGMDVVTLERRWLDRW